MGILTYRPEIDGLRAISVLAVIIYHINEKYLPGGYTGVDVFFVISGFLITSLIKKSHHHGSFTYAEFYGRRIRRIFPLLFTVILFSLAVGSLLFTHENFHELLNTAIFSAGFIANHLFAGWTDYFAPVSHEIPLLHLWSLCIEEQFYLLWPVLLTLLLKVPSNKLRMAIISLLAMVSLGAGSWHKDHMEVFFLLPYRIGELMMGALCAFMPNLRGEIKRLLEIFSLPLLIAGFIFFDNKTHFPGFFALIPCLGAAFFILGTEHESFLQKTFSTPALVWIGKISFSLYLWHWIFLAFTRYLTGTYQLSLLCIGIVIFMTLIFSIITSVWIENPVRVAKWNLKKSFTLLYLLPILGIATACYLLPQKDHSFTFELDSAGGKKNCNRVVSEIGKCMKGDLQAMPVPRILVIGDSHTAHLNSFINTLGKLSGWSAVVISSNSCSPVLGFDENVLINKRTIQDCRELKEFFTSRIQDFDLIVLASRWDTQLGMVSDEVPDPEFLQKFKLTLKWLNDLDKKVIVVSQIPALQNHPKRREKMSLLGLDLPLKTDPVYLEGNKVIKESLRPFENISWYDLASLIEPLQENYQINGKRIYKDTNHLNEWGGMQLGRLAFEKKLLFPLSP